MSGYLQAADNLLPTIWQLRAFIPSRTILLHTGGKSQIRKVRETRGRLIPPFHEVQHLQKVNESGRFSPWQF